MQYTSVLYFRLLNKDFFGFCRLAKSDIEKERRNRNDKINRNREVIAELEAKHQRLTEKNQDQFLQGLAKCKKHQQMLMYVIFGLFGTIAKEPM